VPRFEKVERPRRMFWESRASVCTCCGGSRASQCSLRRAVDRGRLRCGVPGFEDFDRYVEEHGIPEQDYSEAFALWIAEVTGGPVPRFEKVEREKPADGVVIEGYDL